MIKAKDFQEMVGMDTTYRFAQWLLVLFPPYERYLEDNGWKVNGTIISWARH